jgi:glucosamine--fructose-6-phosphate aminotransferase (isomerizing)
MCCLFGLMDTRLVFTGKEKSRMLHALASASEARGTDAAGIAYHADGQLCIYKRPSPGHKLKFRMRDDTRTGMGHARMTTQGRASKNRNNHPFRGYVQGGSFALAHNGVLYNDRTLRHGLGLPGTRIETDSYIAVQLIEKKKALHFDSLRYMAERVEGSFTFTVLDREDDLYIVKGDNPFCLYHFPESGLYLYASTEEILRRAIERMSPGLGHHISVPIRSGDILKLCADGQMQKETFDDAHLYRYSCGALFGYGFGRGEAHRCTEKTEHSHLEEIKSVAMAFGFTSEDIDHLAEQGFTAEELEEVLYSYGGEI